jgi:hypothetical protein
MAKALQKGSNQEKEDATIRCACMALVAPGGKLHDAGVIQPLVSLVRSGTDAQKLWAAEALGSLAIENEPVRAEIGRKDAVKPLVALLTGSSEEPKSRAAYALGNLVLSKPTNDALCELQEVLPVLFTLFREGSLLQKDMAISALLNLVRTRYPSHADIKREKCFPPLVAVVLVGTDEEQTAGLDALALLINERFPDKMATNDGVSATLVMLMESGAHQQKLFSALALADLSRHADFAQLDFDKIATPLVGLVTELLSSGSNGQKTAAAIRLKILAQHNGLRDEIARSGSLLVFVTLLQAESVQLRAFALGGLTKTKFDSIASAEFVREGGLHALKRYVENNSERVDDAAVVLAGLADCNDEIRAELERNGGVKILLDALENGADQGKARILRALEKLTVKHGIRFPGDLFNKLLREGNDEQKLHTAGVIGNLAKDPWTRQLFLKDGIVAALATLLESENDELNETGAAVLYVVASSSEHVRGYLAEAIVPLVKLFCGGADHRGEYSAEVLTLLSSTNDSLRLRLACGGAVVVDYPSYELFAKNDDLWFNNSYEEVGLADFRWKCEDYELRYVESFDADVSTATFVGLLHDGTDMQKEHAAAIIASLSRSPDRVRKQLVDDKAVAPLVALVRDGTILQKGYAAAALANLAFSGCFSEDICRAGGVEVLLSLLQTGSNENEIIAAIGLGHIAMNNDMFLKRVLRQEEFAPAIELLQTGIEQQEPYARADLRCLPLRETIGAEFLYGGSAPLLTILRAGAPEKEKSKESATQRTLRHFLGNWEVEQKKKSRVQQLWLAS